MEINQLNLNQIRVFEAVYRLKSMTQAASELRLTQSGVSQHILHFEEFIGTKLFDRVKQRIVPTSAAAELYEVCSKSLNSLEHAMTDLKEGSKGLRGRVLFGTPTEFGNNVIMPIVNEFLAPNPNVRVRVRIDFASVMNEMLLRGELDFALVDQYRMDPSIVTEKVYDEVLELCVADSLYAKLDHSLKGRKLVETIPFVDYEEDEPVLRMWLQHHLGDSQLSVNVRAYVMDVQGIARLVMGGVGAGILPGHVVDRLIKEGAKIKKIKIGQTPLKNTISLAQVRGRTQSAAAQALMTLIRKRTA